jgi:hypothetical protein
MNASHDKLSPDSFLPPTTAKRPLLITHPQRSNRSALIAGSCVQVQASFGAPGTGGLHTSDDVSATSDDAIKAQPPAQTMRPSEVRTATQTTRLFRRVDYGSHAPAETIYQAHQ